MQKGIKKIHQKNLRIKDVGDQPRKSKENSNVQLRDAKNHMELRAPLFSIFVWSTRKPIVMILRSTLLSMFPSTLDEALIISHKNNNIFINYFFVLKTNSYFKRFTSLNNQSIFLDTTWNDLFLPERGDHSEIDLTFLVVVLPNFGKLFVEVFIIRKF